MRRDPRPEPFDFDAPVDRTGSWSKRWDAHAGTDVLALWVADSDFRTAPAVLEALEARVRHGVFGYTNPPPALREAIVERMRSRHGWSIDPSWIVFLPGVVPGLHLAVRNLSSPGKHVLVPRPVYQYLTIAAQAAARPHSHVPLVLEQGRWVLDLDALRRARRPDSRLFLLCNPQNPGGTVFRRSELERLAALTQDMIIVSDEIHCELVLEPGLEHVPIASLGPEISRRTVTLMSATKTFNFPAAGCAWAIIEDPALRQAFAADLEAHAVHGPSVFGYEATLAALRDGDAWLAAQIDYLRANRDLVEASIGLPMAHVEAGYLAWIDCAPLRIADPHAHFLAHGVALSPGTQFGAPGFVRLNFGTQRRRLQSALERMRAAVQALR